MSHDFPGGGVILASILHRLVHKDTKNKKQQKKNEDLCKRALKNWEKALIEWEKTDVPNGVKNKLPDRFIRMEPFATVPAMKKHLKPDTKFLRVHEKEDSDHFYQHVQKAFCIDSNVLLRNVIVIGGEDPAEAWVKVNEALGVNGTNVNQVPGSDGEPAPEQKPEQKPAKGDVVFILAKSKDELIGHAKCARERYREKQFGEVIIGHIDVSKLAESYPLQTDTSYERTVGDICRATMPAKRPGSEEGDDEQQPMLSELLQGNENAKENPLDHLIIRIGNAACLVASPIANAPASDSSQETKADTANMPAGEDSQSKAPFALKLFCHPDRCAPTTFPGLGYMLAYDMLLCAAVVNQVARVQVSGTNEPAACYGQLLEGARIGVQATYRCFVEGFGIFVSDDEEEKLTLVELPADEFFAKFVRHGIQAQKQKPVGELSTLYYKLTEVPKKAVGEPPPKTILDFNVHYETARSPNRFWRMVVPKEGGTDEDHCLKVAKDYLAGNQELPLVDLGKNKLVDRQEVEDYLFLQRLLQSYHEDTKWRQPLCIGVFGQPGAGKSFGVKQLVSEMSGSSEAFAKDSIEVNLSQLRTLKELADCFHKVRDACLQQPIPLVFFDEFDSGFEDRAFGWLKYFLAPMQDGKFFSDGKDYSFGKAIFVFAGGVNHSFAEFNERSRNPEFCNAKGPDFISRLRGILNICSMNKPEGEKEAVEHIYKIRRAVFLRHLLEERLGKPEKGSETELIEPTLAEAFLTIPRFKHGARSLEAILKMSTLARGECFTHSNLPPRDQLDMHVDAREFLRLAGVLTPRSKT